MKPSAGTPLPTLVLAACLLAAPPGSAQTPVPKAPPNLPPPVILKGTPSLRLKQPRLVSFRVTEGPFLNFELRGRLNTVFEAELADYDPKHDTFFRPSLWSPVCRPGGGLSASSEPGGNPYKVTWNFSFWGIENSGKLCAMEIRPYGAGPDDPVLQAGDVRLPTIETYTISNTWDLLSFTTPSGKKLAASASKGVLPCQLASVGTAGAFATGVVNDGGDISFQLRNGVLQEDCRFETSTALEVKPDYFLKKAEWQFTSDSLCNASDRQFGTQAGSGSTVTFFFDHTAIFKVRFEATCRPDAHDPARNGHLYKARLSRVEILGPPGHSWRDAFK